MKSTTTTAPNATSIKAMVIELRKVQEYPRLSEETTAFSADLYIDGVKRGIAENEGKGGNTNYGSFGKSMEDHKENQKFILAAEEYCKTLPPEKHEYAGMEPWETPMNLESFIDNLLDKALQEKDIAKFNAGLTKKMLTCILIGNPANPAQYSYIDFKHPIADILNTPARLVGLKNRIVKIKAELNPGEQILNTNIPADILAVTELIPVVPEMGEKAKQAMLTGIVWGKPDFTKLTGRSFNMPIADLLKTPEGKSRLKNTYKIVMDQLKKGEVIFNTNIPDELKTL